MKILILGAGGMLGHQLYLTAKNLGLNVFATVRKPKEYYRKLGLFSEPDLFPGIDVTNFRKLETFLEELQPDWIINCVGLTTRKINEFNESTVIQVNSTLPYVLKLWSLRAGKRFIHISTDCVFSGKSGPYTEDSPTDAKDFYGKSKALGEVQGKGILTLRTSIIGMEIDHKTELLEWLFAQKGKVINGFTQVIYSGVTTNYLSQLILAIIQTPNPIEGLYHVASQPISKYSLLSLANQIFSLNCQINPVDSPQSNKTLIADKLLLRTGHSAPSWETQLLKIKNEILYKPIKGAA